MPQYKLVYFNACGKAEIIRWVFKVAGVEFEDSRYKQGAWAAAKPDTPFGQSPTLEIDGIVYCQSLAIARYIAKKHGLAGSSLEEQARADMIVDCCFDMGAPGTAVWKCEDPVKKEELKKKFVEEQLPKSLEYLERMLEENGDGDGWFVGEKVTWADLAVTTWTTGFLKPLDVTSPWERFPKLKALVSKVEALPAIAQWLKERPQTRF